MAPKNEGDGGPPPDLKKQEEGKSGPKPDPKDSKEEGKENQGDSKPPGDPKPPAEADKPKPDPKPKLDPEGQKGEQHTFHVELRIKATSKSAAVEEVKKLLEEWEERSKQGESLYSGYPGGTLLSFKLPKK